MSVPSCATGCVEAASAHLRPSGVASGLPPAGAKGTRFWDPMGLASDGDAAAFRRRRMSEIKNGRVAMLACLGWIVPEYWRFPGYLSPSQGLKFEDVPSGFAALAKVPAAGWAQIALFVATLELFGMKQEA